MTRFAEQKPSLLIHMNIGNAIKLTRSAKGLSLETLAERTTLSASYLSMIETGKREPTLSTVKKIAEGLNVPPPILLFLAADSDELTGIDEEAVRRLSAAVVDVMRNDA